MSEQARLPRGRLIAAVIASVLVAGFIVAAGILPAEFGRDPTGLGKLTGLSRLWGPKEVEVDPNAGEVERAKEYAEGYQTHTVELSLAAADTPRAEREVEYKVRMEEGAVVLYSWEVIGARNADDVYYDHHGHTTPVGGEEVLVSTYRQDYGLARNGSLMAPFEGIHGWFFSNGGLDPVRVRVTISGFYELVPAGEDGNLAGALPLPATAP